MKFAALAALCLAYLVSLARAQYGFPAFSGPHFGAGYVGVNVPLQAARDPRQNPGPVVFPPAPPDSGETSGVVVGASGYGFVPPQRNPLIAKTSLIAKPPLIAKTH